MAIKRKKDLCKYMYTSKLVCTLAVSIEMLQNGIYTGP